MKAKNGLMKALVFAAVFAAVAVLLGFMALAGGGELKSLTRAEDPVVVSAVKLALMKDAQIQKLALLAYKDGALKPIPFQVDERNQDGMFIYKEGPEAKPGDSDNKCNGSDELVFMAWDTGGQAPDGTALPCSPARAAELTVTDPVKSGKGFAYLAECKDEPPRSSVDYVRNEYDGKHDWVKTDRYHFAEQRGNSYFDRLALKGSSGKVGPNLVDRIKGRGKMVLIGGIMTIDTPESDLKGSIRAWIDGPVRVVHLMTAFIQFSVVKLNLGGQSENLFYPNYFVTPIQVNTPINPGSVLRSFELRYAIDWLKDMEGAKYYDPVNQKGVTLDGKMSPDEKNMDYTTGHEWYALTGPQGNLVVRQILPEQWLQTVPIKLYYVDDITAPDPPESDPGQRCPGFLLDTMADIAAGKYKYYLYYMVPDQPPPASVPDMLNIVDHPLQVTARAYP
ncbi:MAG TPA: hypothetical protein VM658_04915 [bacterium]|nr:hypothetical protein [bacterium]